jgi:hypothetical protein
MKSDTVKMALADLSKLQERFIWLAERERDPTNKNILSTLFNEPAILVANNSINSFRRPGTKERKP